MNLEEAIAHYLKIAEENEKDAEQFKRLRASQDMILHCYECASEHRQLAKWLRELKQRRNYENGCQYCKYKFRSDEDEPCIICSHNYTDKFKDDGTREVNADE